MSFHFWVELCFLVFKRQIKKHAMAWILYMGTETLSLHITSPALFDTLCLWEQIWTPVPGTSRPRSVPCGPASNASIAAATTRATAIQTSFPWTTAYRASWDSEWTCRRTSRWTTTFGWSARSSPNPFLGRNCCSEAQPLQNVFAFLSKTVWDSFLPYKTLTAALCYLFWQLDFLLRN